MTEADVHFVARLSSSSAYVPWDSPLGVTGRSGDGMADVFDRSIAHCRRSPSWGKTPAYVEPLPLIPAASPPVQLQPFHSLEERARYARSARAARVYVAQQNAIDAPFEAIKREKAGVFEGRDIRRGAAAAKGATLGFTTNETSDTASSETVSKRPLRTRLKVDPQAKRLKRMRSTVSHAARLLHFDAHTERHAQLWNKKFLTLTYANLGDWESGHFTAFRKAMREWCARRGVRLRFVWVAELQKRGALHYHVIVWLPKGKYLPFADAQGWWPHGRTNIVNAQSPVGYITKYASKATSADALGFPKGARICGHGGLTDDGRRHIRYWNAPIWVREALSGRADIRKVTGGYMDKFTGEFLASPWRVEIGADGQVYAYRIDQQPSELAA